MYISIDFNLCYVNNSTFRVLWVFIFGFGVCFSLYLSVGILNKFYYSPVSEINIFSVAKYLINLFKHRQ